MRKEGKDNVFNILYWNINNKAENRRVKGDREENLAISIINEKIKKFLNTEVECIVFTEAYNKLESKLINVNSEYKKLDFFDGGCVKNQIVIAAKKSQYEHVNKGEGVNFVHIRNKEKRLNIIGYRTMWINYTGDIFYALKYINGLCMDKIISCKNYDCKKFSDEIEKYKNEYKEIKNGKNSYQRENAFITNEMKDSYIVEQLKDIKIDDNKSLLDSICERKAITDYKNIYYKLQVNSVLDYVKRIKDEKVIVVGDFNISQKNENLLNFYKIKDDNEEGFVVCENDTMFHDKLDYLYLKGCKKKVFKVEEDMLKFYFNNIEFIQKNCNNMLEIKSPFPDHNLLFASIDIGYDE